MLTEAPQISQWPLAPPIEGQVELTSVPKKRLPFSCIYATHSDRPGRSTRSYFVGQRQAANRMTETDQDRPTIVRSENLQFVTHLAPCLALRRSNPKHLQDAKVTPSSQPLNRFLSGLIFTSRQHCSELVEVAREALSRNLSDPHTTLSLRAQYQASFLLAATRWSFGSVK